MTIAEGAVVLYGLDASGALVPLLLGADGKLSGVTFNDAEGDPASIGAAADGNSVYAARRNHVHAARTAQVKLTSGAISINSGTFIEWSSGLRLTIGASAGDVLIAGLNAYINAEAKTLQIDIATIISGAIVNRWANATNGFVGFYADVSRTDRTQGVVPYTVVSGDISAGNVTVSPVSSSNGIKTINCDADSPIFFWVANLGH